MWWKASELFCKALLLVWAILACSIAAIVPAFALGTLGEPKEVIELAIGQGRLLRFDKPVDSVLVADPSIADVKVVSAQLLYIFGSSVGRTNLIAASSEERLLGSVAVKVVRDPSDVRGAIQSVEAKSTLDLGFAENQLIIKGTVKNVEEAMNAAAVAEQFAPRGTRPLNRTRLASSPQINIRVRFAEVSRNDLLRLGIDWSALLTPGHLNFGLLTGSFIQPVNTGEVFGTARAGVATRTANVNVLLDALQRQGVLTTLAEPNLTAISGETARFLAGGEIPIPVPQSQQVTTIQYKPFGVSLTFTPTLLPDDRIGLRVEPEVSELSAANSVTIQGLVVPALTVRRAETTVEVGSGETFAIAGLFQRDVSNAVDKFPVLGDVPVIGPLFQSVRYQRNETELVILITPYIVQPAQDRKMALPTDSAPATSADAARERARTSGKGPAGFIVN